MERKHSRNIESMVERETAEKRERETGREREKERKQKYEVELNFHLENEECGDSEGPGERR
jgi:hypothetical protein